MSGKWLNMSLLWSFDDNQGLIFYYYFAPTELVWIFGAISTIKVALIGLNTPAFEAHSFDAETLFLW